MRRDSVQQVGSFSVRTDRPVRRRSSAPGGPRVLRASCAVQPCAVRDPSSAFPAPTPTRMLPRPRRKPVGSLEGGAQTMDHKLQVLAQVPLFAELPRKELEAIGRLCDEVSLKAGYVVAREGTSGSEFFVIVSGTAAVSQGGAHLRDLGPGDFFGELALLGHVARTATVMCTSDGDYLVIGRREFNQLLADYPTIQSAVLQALASRIATLAPDVH